MISKFPRLLIALLLAVVVAGCSKKAVQSEAEMTAENAFRRIQIQDFDGVIALYGSGFFTTTSPRQWIQSLEQTHEKLGSLKSWKLASVLIVPGTNGTQIRLIYNTEYEDSQAIEELNLLKLDGESVFTILGHKISSPGLP